MPEIQMSLTRGEMRRVYFIEIQDPMSQERVCLPSSDDAEASTFLYHKLAEIYGEHNLFFYQWDVVCYVPGSHG